MADIQVLNPLTPEVIKMVRESVGVDEKKIAEAKEQLRHWLERQPHLPHSIDDKRLESIYLRSKGSIERAKSTLDMYYSVRTMIPEFFTNRDIAEPWSHITQLLCCFPLPKLTDDGCRVTIARLLSSDVEKYSAISGLKAFFMVLDIMLLEDYAAKDIFILDCTDVKMGHAACFTPTVLKNLLTTALYGYSARLKGIFITNAPPYVVPLVNFVRSVLKPKIASRVFVEGEGYDILHKHVSPKILPNELQGEAGPIKDMWDPWIKKLHCYRNWFLEEEKYKVDESKRPEQLANGYSLFGCDGSFRKLNID